MLLSHTLIRIEQLLANKTVMLLIEFSQTELTTFQAHHYEYFTYVDP